GGLLARLAAGDSSLTELARPFRMSLPAIHKHLRVLARAGLVAHAKHGRVRRCRLVAEPMRDAAHWISRYRRFWERQFDALAHYLEDPNAPSEEDSPWPPLRKPPRSPFGSSARSRRRGKKSSRRGPGRRTRSHGARRGIAQRPSQKSASQTAAAHAPPAGPP